MGAVVQQIAPTFVNILKYPTAIRSAVGVGGWVAYRVELLSPDVETSLMTQDLNLLLTKSRVYRQISDYRDNRLSKDVYTTQIILIINFIKERRQYASIT